MAQNNKQNLKAEGWGRMLTKDGPLGVPMAALEQIPEKGERQTLSDEAGKRIVSNLLRRLQSSSEEA